MTKKESIIFDMYPLYGSPKLISLKATEREPRKNQKTITESMALMTTSSPFHELLSDKLFSLLNKYLLNKIPKNVPTTTIISGIKFIVKVVLYIFSIFI
jgi:hypothetical protein